MAEISQPFLLVSYLQLGNALVDELVVGEGLHRTILAAR